VAKRSTSGRHRAGRPLVRLKTLAALDSRTHAARRAHALVAGLESDLGGPDNVTVVERQLLQHAGVLGAVIEHQEAQWLAGEEVDDTGLLAAVNCQRRLLEAIGLQRRAKDITPDSQELEQDRTVELWVLFEDGRVQNVSTGEISRREDVPDSQDDVVRLFISESDSRV
jgi:hypothetical protein